MTGEKHYYEGVHTLRRKVCAHAFSAKNLIAFAIISITISPITFSCTYVRSVGRMVEVTSSGDLGIIPQLERKDTKMLCLEGCPLLGPDAWDGEHENQSAHDSERCLRASISMINSYYGGHLSQDRISYYVYEECSQDGSPENDLGHGKGLRGVNAASILRWALNEASVIRLTGKPSFIEIKQWIDSNHPIMRDHGTNHRITVIDGYDMEGEMVHVIDPLTGTENTVPYDDLDVFVVWVPIGDNITARSDEPTIWEDSDGDGIVDFDEINRFHTDPYNPDTDGDGIDDKTEIRAYTFLSDDFFDSEDLRKPDADGDSLRAELDWDSDNGGTPDGSEDLNKNGKVDPGETDPLDPSDDPFPAIPMFEYYPEKPRAGDLVIFNASLSYDPNDVIVSYTWNFGDGNVTSINEPIISHTYIKAGRYTVVLNISDNDHFWNSVASNLTVKMITDLNEDDVVDIVDICVVAHSFGCRPGDEKWNQVADLNEDEVIDILDVTQVAKDCGKRV